MTWDFQLENVILKTKEALILWQTEKGVVEIDKNTFAAPVKIDGERKGFVFHGHGRLVLDTIIETCEGAIGKPFEKEINKPFLMIGNTEGLSQHLITTNKEDIANVGFESEKEFITMAEELCRKFFKKNILCTHHFCGENSSVTFAFQNKADDLDMLAAKGSKLVYKATDIVFVSSKNKVVLKTPKEVILSNDQKSFVIKRFCMKN